MPNKLTHNLDFYENDSPVKGFQEIVLSVCNLDKMVDFYERVFHWEIISQNEGSSDLKQLWELDDSVEIKEVLMQNPGDKEGFLRLVQFKNVAQEQIRAAAQTWDSGGIFDFNIRTPDLNTLYQEMQNEGWNAHADPIRYTFNVYDVSEVLMKGPDGITIAAIQRFNPPLEGFYYMRKTSRIFNSSIITHDLVTSRKFYIEQLGFHLFFETLGDQRSGEQNVLGFPQNINKDITVPIIIVRPDKNNYGSIELLEPRELKGKNCASLAKPPNLGLLLYRFPVKDIESYCLQIKAKGVEIQSNIRDLFIQPYGRVKIFAIRSPEGVWIEFVELQSDK